MSKVLSKFAFAVLAGAMCFATCTATHAQVISWMPSVDLFAGGDNDDFISQNGDFVVGFNGGATPTSVSVGDSVFAPATLAELGSAGSGISGGGVTVNGNFTGQTGGGTFGDGRFTGGTVSSLITPGLFEGTNLTLTGLIPGTTYETQILINDARGGGGAGIRDEEWQVAFNDGNGGTTITGIAQLTNRPFNTAADPNIEGDFIIGTFVADSTGTQSIDFIASRGNVTAQELDLGGAFGPAQNFNAGQAQINAFQLRAIAVPEPASATLLLGGLLLGLSKRRRK